MLLDDAQTVFYRAHVTWAAGDLPGLLALFDENITYLVNVDGISVP